jgi:hypothetical protein
MIHRIRRVETRERCCANTGGQTAWSEPSGIFAGHLRIHRQQCSDPRVGCADRRSIGARSYFGGPSLASAAATVLRATPNGFQSLGATTSRCDASTGSTPSLPRRSPIRSWLGGLLSTGATGPLFDRRSQAGIVLGQPARNGFTLSINRRLLNMSGCAVWALGGAPLNTTESE